MRLLPFTVFLWVAILLVIGIVLDGGGRVAHQQEALGIAQAAARAGTNAATGTSVHGDAFALNTDMAVAGAQTYLAQSNIAGTATVAGDTVTVTVETIYYPVILGPLADLAPVTIRATGTARLIGG